MLPIIKQGKQQTGSRKPLWLRHVSIVQKYIYKCAIYETFGQNLSSSYSKKIKLREKKA